MLLPTKKNEVVFVYINPTKTTINIYTYKMLINRTIDLKPIYMNSNILEHLLSESKKILKDECTKEDGYIMCVNKISRIIGNYNLRFELELDVDILKLNISDVVMCKIIMIYEDGIFALAKEKQRVLIPSKHLVDNGFIHNNGIFTNDETNSIYDKDSLIKVEITQMMYNKKNFNCIGKLFIDT